jgi:hypothetical protein
MGLSVSQSVIALFKLLLLACLVDSYIIDSSTCSNTEEVRLAVDEAINMAEYTNYRATKEKTQVPDVINKILGDQGLNVIGGR